MGLLGQDSDVISMLCGVWIGWLTIYSTSSEFSIGFKTGTRAKECTLHEQNASPFFFLFLFGIVCHYNLCAIGARDMKRWH